MQIYRFFLARSCKVAVAAVIVRIWAPAVTRSSSPDEGPEFPPEDRTAQHENYELGMKNWYGPDALGGRGFFVWGGYGTVRIGRLRT
jgi:hypothetical protein